MGMRVIKPISMDIDNFVQYGTCVDMINPIGVVKLGEKPVLFYPDVAHVHLGPMASNVVNSGVCKVFWRPFVVDRMELHSFCGEGILPLNRDIIVQVAPAGVDQVDLPDAIEAFFVKQGTFVSIKEGVWHHGPFLATEDQIDGDTSVSVMITLPNRTYANDCIEVGLVKDQRVKIAFP